MLGSHIKFVGHLTRLDTCAIVFLCVAIPLFHATGDLYNSVLRALPLLTICMCGFVINDLHDIDKDRKNHPGRPLPNGDLSPFAGSVIYFVLLGVSLTLIKALVEFSYVFVYLLLLIGLINYNYVVLYIPALKNLYVAAVGTIPLFILASLMPQPRGYLFVVGSLFLFLLAREILMDIEDVAGDDETFPKIVGLEPARWIAFSIKALGDMVLATQIRDSWGIVILAMFLLADLLCLWQWQRKTRREMILFVMKLQLLLGIYYVL